MSGREATLMRMAREFEANEGRDLRGFLDFVSFRTTEDDESVAATEAEDHDGVRVMTIHNAKGLEFPVVAVGGLGRSLLGGGRAPDLNIGRGAGGESRVGMRLARLGARSVDLYERESLAEEASGLDSAEELRLFYVAATRARERLLLSGVMQTSRPEELKPTTPVSERLIRSFSVDDTERDSHGTIPPAPSPDPDSSPGKVEVAVRVNLPSPEQAAELARAASVGRSPAVVGVAPPPIVEPASPVTPRRPLSYSALEDYRRCGYRFYMERVLGLEAVGAGGGAVRGRDEGRAFGNAVHELLEWSSVRRWIEPPAGRVRRVLEAQGLKPEADADRVLALVRGWLESSLREELTGADLRSEVPFLVELGGSVMRGKLDLLAEPLGEPPTVVDYKTDRLDGTEPAEHAAGYEIQRDLYALATSQATATERIRVVYVFLERPGEPVIAELDEAAIAAARERLEASVAELAEGRFEVTGTPDWGLCHDCPARRRLCSAPAEPPTR